MANYIEEREKGKLQNIGVKAKEHAKGERV